MIVLVEQVRYKEIDIGPLEGLRILPRIDAGRKRKMICATCQTEIEDETFVWGWAEGSYQFHESCVVEWGNESDVALLAEARKEWRATHP